MDEQVKLLTLADGQKMPQEGFGTFKITDQATITSAIEVAYKTGYRLFDTAQVYQNEAEIGHALQTLALPRDELFITTKITEANQGYLQTIKSVKESLAKLKTDYVNLLLIHWPLEQTFFESWAALEEVKKMGLARSIGVSNHEMTHLQYLATHANEMPVVDQIECHPLLSQKPLIEYNKAHHIVTQAWSPLGRGTILDNPRITKIAATYAKSPAQIILRWHLQNGIAFIPKSIHEKRIEQNINIADFCLTPEEMQQINQLHCFKRVGKEPTLVYEYNFKY